MKLESARNACLPLPIASAIAIGALHGLQVVVGKGGAELQPLYSYFGQVTSGMAVVNKINADGSSSSAGTPKVVHKVLKVTISVS